MKFWLMLAGGLVLLYAALVVWVMTNQRRMIFFPTHDVAESTLQPWRVGDRLVGYARPVERPAAVWLMLHGNGGQASQRGYVLARMAPTDALYVLEYPGYGQRAGEPSMDAINAAALHAYEELRRMHPSVPVCVLGESIGSGPASMLATHARPPDKLVLVVPFDTLANVAAGHFPLLPVRMMLKDRWDNLAALKGYAGPIDIFASEEDRVIALPHARKLAAALPQARFVPFVGGHNEWSGSPDVRIER